MKLAAIDIGSNAIRLMITKVYLEDSVVKYKKETLIRVPLRLGQEAFYNNEFSEKKAQDLVKSMKAFRLLIDVFQAEDYRACATSAMRDAKNGPALVKKIKEECNIDIEIISGIEESKLVCQGITEFVKQDLDRPFLSIDVGGGSTETLLIWKEEILEAYSWNIGTLRILGDKVSQKEWKAMQEWLENIRTKYPTIYGMGSGGNINKIKKMYVSGESHIGFQALKNAHQHLTSFTLQERIIELDLKPDRADVIVPAAEIFINVMTWAGIEKLLIPNRGLADGIVQDLYLKRNAV